MRPASASTATIVKSTIYANSVSVTVQIEAPTPEEADNAQEQLEIRVGGAESGRRLQDDAGLSSSELLKAKDAALRQQAAIIAQQAADIAELKAQCGK